MTATDQDIARAQALGRLAADDGLTLADNPYTVGDDPATRVLRGRWAAAFADAGGVTVENGDQPEG